MKTVKMIKEKLKELEGQMAWEQKEKKKVSKMNQQRFDTLTTCKLYLMSKPSEAFVLKERARIENRINLLVKAYVPLDPETNKKSVCKKDKSDYEKSVSIPNLRQQLTTLNFLLSN